MVDWEVEGGSAAGGGSVDGMLGAVGTGALASGVVVGAVRIERWPGGAGGVHAWWAGLEVERSPLELGRVDGRGSAAGVEGGDGGEKRRYGFTRGRWTTCAEGEAPSVRRGGGGGRTICANA